MTKLTDETIDRLKDVDIRDLADRLGMEVRSARGNVKCFNALPPAHAHGDRNPSLAFYPPNNPRMFKCFTCGIAGNTIQLVQKVQGVDFIPACEYIARQYNIPLEHVGRPTSHDRRKNVRTPAPAITSAQRRCYDPLRLTKTTGGSFSNTYDLDALPHAELYAEFYNLTADPDQRLIEWWTDRGLSPALLDRYGWKVVTKDTYKAIRTRHSDDELLQAGLLDQNPNGGLYEAFSDRYRYAVPYRVNGTPGTAYNGVVAWLRFRALDLPERTRDGKKPAKYLPPRGTSKIIYNYNSLAEWLYLATDGVTPAPLVVSESETDLYAQAELSERAGGHFYGIALSGGGESTTSRIVMELAELIKPIDRRNVIRILVDKDNTGARAFYPAISQTLKSLGIREGEPIIAPDPYKDYGEYLRAQAGKNMLYKAMAG